MTTAFDLIQHDDALQDLWVKRVLASVIDAILVFAPVYVVMGIFISLGASLWYMGGFASGVVWFLYSFLFEAAAGGSIGKLMFGMKVVSVEGKMEPLQLLIRNATKLVAVLMVIDVFLAMITDAKDPRQRIMDRIAGTTLIFQKGN